MPSNAVAQPRHRRTDVWPWGAGPEQGGPSSGLGDVGTGFGLQPSSGLEGLCPGLGKGCLSIWHGPGLSDLTCCLSPRAPAPVTQRDDGWLFRVSSVAAAGKGLSGSPLGGRRPWRLRGWARGTCASWGPALLVSEVHV